MTKPRPHPGPEQPELFEQDAARSLLDQLLTDSKLYKGGQDFKDLLAFVIRLRNVAPFNAMLLQVQKPGVSYVASAFDWADRFERYPKDGARPLLILWPFGPVALVYDVLDTEGKSLPKDVAAYFARGEVTAKDLARFLSLLDRKHIQVTHIDAGDNKAGLIRAHAVKPESKGIQRYSIQLNRNHTAPVQFNTLAHELAHLFLGHLGPDKQLKVPDRPPQTHEEIELEAEVVAYVVCKRNGVSPKSQKYLSNFVNQATTVDSLDLYQIMRAAGQIEAALNLIEHTRFEKPNRTESAHNR